VRAETQARRRRERLHAIDVADRASPVNDNLWSGKVGKFQSSAVLSRRHEDHEGHEDL